MGDLREHVPFLVPCPQPGREAFQSGLKNQFQGTQELGKWTQRPKERRERSADGEAGAPNH